MAEKALTLRAFKWNGKAEVTSYLPDFDFICAGTPSNRHSRKVILKLKDWRKPHRFKGGKGKPVTQANPPTEAELISDSPRNYVAVYVDQTGENSYWLGDEPALKWGRTGKPHTVLECALCGNTVRLSESQVFLLLEAYNGNALDSIEIDKLQR